MYSNSHNFGNNGQAELILVASDEKSIGKVLVI